MKPPLRSGTSRSVAALLLLSVLVVALVVVLVPTAYLQPFSSEISVSPSTVYEGGSATLSITTSPSSAYSAYGPYTCEWFDESPGSATFISLASSDCSSSVSTGTLSSPGTWSFELQVTSSYYSGPVVSNVVTVKVLGVDQSFTLVGSLTTITIGPTLFFEADYTNNIPSAFTGVVWFEVENFTTRQTILIAATSLTLPSGASAPAYLGLSTFAKGLYNVTAFVTTTENVPLSPSNSTFVQTP